MIVGPTLALTRADCGARETRAASGAAPCWAAGSGTTYPEQGRRFNFITAKIRISVGFTRYNSVYGNRRTRRRRIEPRNHQTCSRVSE